MAEEDVFITNQNFEESLLNNSNLESDVVQSKLMKRNSKKGKRKSGKGKNNNTTDINQENEELEKEKGKDNIILSVADNEQKEADISIDDSLKIEESPPEVHREIDPTQQARLEEIEDGSNVVFQETPVNERISLPLSLEKKEFKSSPSLTSNSTPRINSPATNSPRIIGARFTIDPANNPINLSDSNNNNNNNNEFHSSQFTTVPFSPTIKPFNNNTSNSELPFYQPDPLPAASNNRFGGFNRSIAEAHAPLGGFSTVTTSTHTTQLPATTTTNTVIPMVEVDILPEVGANGAEVVEEPEIPNRANKVDAFPIILCLICFLVLVGVSLAIFFL